jgi:transglutaminase-like putative cysteine protease
MKPNAILLLGLLVATALLARPAPAEAQPEPLGLDRAVALLESAGGPDDYPNANSVVVLDETYVDFDETGAYQEYSHSLVKILTDEGLEKHGDESIVYHRRYGTIEVVAARVIKADGTEVIVGDDLITEGTPPQIAAMDIYESDFREKVIVFPSLEVGDATELLIRIDYEPLIEEGWNGMYFLQYTSPMLTATLTIEGPAGMPLKHVVKNGEPEFTERVEGDRRFYTWTARNTEQIEPEPAMPSPAQFATRVIASTMHTWEELSRYLWEMSDDKCVAEDSVKDLVDEITEGLTTTEDKMRAIHYWIAKNVRYLGIAMDRGAFLEPHFAAYTLEKEYGVCRDKAVLMVTMFEEIGVPAWVVALNPSRRTDTEVPTLFFEHGIVAVKGDDGDYRYIDPTMETSREIYTKYTGGRWVLLLTEEGSDIRQVPPVPSSENAGEIVDAARLDDDGGITGSVTITGQGMYEEILRTIAKSAKEEQLRMMWEEAVQSLYAGAEMTHFEMTDYEDLYEPLTVSVSYKIGDYALDADPYVLFRVPAATGHFDFLSEIMLERLTGLATRRYPVALGTSLGLAEESDVVIPSGYAVESLPDNVTFQEGPITMAIAYEFVPPAETGGNPVVRYRRAFGMESFEISPEGYASLKEAIRLASRSTRGEVILKREEG